MPPLLLTAIAGATVLGLTIGFWAMPIGRALGLLDHPDGQRKRHARVTPLVGGLAVTLSAIGTLLPTVQGLPNALPAVVLVGATLAMFIIGAIDDRLHLSPGVRLAAAGAVLATAVLTVPAFGLSVLLFSGATALVTLGIGGGLFALLCLVGLLNAVNMADGKNGVVIGQGVLWMLMLAAHGEPGLVPLFAAVAATLLALLPFNMAGRLFLGDGGSYALSTLAGLGAIAAHNYNPHGFRADEVALLFAVPVLDTIRLMTTRMRQGRSPFEGDREHLHHYLYHRLGWPLGLVVYLALVAIPNVGALLWPGTGLWWLMATLAAYGATIRAARPLRAPGPPAG